MKELLLKSIVGLVYFLLGIVLGLGLVFVAYKIIVHIAKKQEIKVERKDLIDPKPIQEKYYSMYLESYSTKRMGQRFVGVKDLALAAINEIASLYYSGKDAYLNISIVTMYSLINDVTDKVNNLINEILDSKIFQTVYRAYAFGHNAKQFITKVFGKGREEASYLDVDIRKQKLSFVLDIMDNHQKDDKPKEKKETPNASVEKNYWVLDKFINSKVKELLNTIIEEANRVYSNNVVGEEINSGHELAKLGLYSLENKQNEEEN